MKSTEKLISIAESLGWKMQQDSENPNEFLLESSSPAGQDIIIYVEWNDNSRNTLVEGLIWSLEEFVDNFDPSEEASLWLDETGHGKNGAPERMIDVYNDMVAVKEMAQELLDAWKGNRPDVLVCSECGSTNVQMQAWVNANTHEYIDLTDPDNDDEGNNWCEDCQEHTRLCPLYEFEEMMDDWARENGLAWNEDITYEEKRNTYIKLKGIRP